MVQAHRLLSIDRADMPKLRVLAPIFGVSAAATVVLASLSKALFLAQNPISLLPWMFLGSSAMTATASLVYVALMRKFGLSSRFPALLGLAVASLVALRVGYPMVPSAISIAILLWCPTVGHLVIVQVWNAASTLLPTRQGKRLFPVLAAITTLGAAIGGGMVPLLLTWIAAADLLLVGALLLSWPLLTIRSVVRHLERDVKEDASTDASTEGAPGETTETSLGSTLRDIGKNPLLGELAMLVFLLQAASLVIDYQFSAELKPMFDADGIARFLGTFYWMSNVVVLIVTLLFTGRALRRIGIGVALAMSGIFLGVGSSAYVTASLVGGLPTFWVIAATAFCERVAEYSFSRPATQMLYMPLQTRGGERAKTIIDGVIQRSATAIVSVLLLVAAPEVATQFRLSPPAIIACTMVVFLGIRIGPHYRQAIFDALRARRLDAQLTGYLRDGLGKDALVEIHRRLDGTPRDIRRALAMARELSLPLDQERLATLVLHDDERVAHAALETMEGLGRTPSRELLGQMLDADRPPAVLRAVLRSFADRANAELANAVRHLTRHPDPGVASAACVLRIRAAGTTALQSFDEEVAGSERGALRRSEGRSEPRGERFTGVTRAGAFARELPELLGSSDVQACRGAIEQMGQLGLPFFIDPLIACTTRPDLRANAVAALGRYGDRALAPIRQALADDGINLASRIALLEVVERIASFDAVALLVGECGKNERALCDRAVESLWRLAANDAAPRPDEALVMALVDDEMTRLERYAGIEMLLAMRPTPRRLMFLDELHAQLTRSERRVFRLLGLCFDRDAMQRALLHYRSPERRARSNAIELLEQHVGSRFGKLVPLVERAEGTDGKLRPRSMVIRGMEDKTSVERLLQQDEPWLERMWQWVKERDPATPISWDDPLDRVLTLRDMPSFEGIAAEQLLPLAEALHRLELHDGGTVFAAGSGGRELYWVLQGEISSSLNDKTVATVERGGCFGELEALDGRARHASAVARGDAVVLELSQGDFEDVIDVEPRLLRNLIGVLSRRLRDAS